MWDLFKTWIGPCWPRRVDKRAGLGASSSELKAPAQEASAPAEPAEEAHRSSPDELNFLVQRISDLQSQALFFVNLPLVHARLLCRCLLNRKMWKGFCAQSFVRHGLVCRALEGSVEDKAAAKAYSNGS